MSACSNIQSIEQKRAKAALEEVRQLAKAEDEDKKKYLSRANELPSMIQMNGLAQTTAFYLSKTDKTDGHDQLYQLLQKWLCRDDKEQLINKITNADINQYRILQAEAITFLLWVKKFSRAFLATT